MKNECSCSVRGDLAQQAIRFIANGGTRDIGHCRLCDGLSLESRVHVRLRDERLRRRDQQQQQ